MRVVLIACVTLLTACASIPLSHRVEFNPAELQSLNAWAWQGRAAASNPYGSWQGRVQWQQENDTFNVQVDGPFGIGRGVIDGTPAQVQVQMTGQGTQTINNPDAWLQSQLGWSAPIAQARFWLLGVPDPSLPASSPVYDGSAIVFEQLGWQLRASDHQQIGNYPLPGQIELSRNGERLRIRFDRWAL